eukprot:222945-Pleurochrysis_carterae.AAC.3
MKKKSVPGPSTALFRENASRANPFALLVCTLFAVAQFTFWSPSGQPNSPQVRAILFWESFWELKVPGRYLYIPMQLGCFLELCANLGKVYILVTTRLKLSKLDAKQLLLATAPPTILTE